MGLEGQAPKDLSEQDGVTVRPFSIIFERSRSLRELPDYCKNPNIACTLQKGPKDEQGNRRLCPPVTPLSGCLKEKVIYPGFTQGSFFLAILFTFSEERRGFLGKEEQ